MRGSVHRSRIWQLSDRAVAIVLLVMVMASAGPALAQEPAAEQPEAPAVEETGPVSVEAPTVEAPKGIEAIEVTGERLDMTNVQDEAQAITAFDMGDLDRLGISNVDGLATNVPGLHVGQQGQAAIITLRGVGTENASLTGEAGVAFHVDGIYLGRPAAARVAFFDLQFLDVKRGPQGLQGGKNSTSGSISVNTADPTPEFGTSADVLFGNYDRQRFRGHINVPIGSGEMAAARAAFFYEQRDGFLDNQLVSTSNDPFDADNFGMRYKLLFTPTDSLKAVFGYHYFKEGGNGPQADLVPGESRTPCKNNLPYYNRPRTWDPVSIGYESRMPRPVACLHLQLRGGNGSLLEHAPGAEDLDPREIYADTPSTQDDTYWGFNGRVEYEVPAMPLLGETHLKLLAGSQRTETQFGQDYDASNLGPSSVILNIGSKVHEYSGELQWTGNGFGERLEWQSSLFLTRERGNSLTAIPVQEQTSQQGGGGGQVELTTHQDTENKSYGAGLHGAYHLTDALTFSLGGRWIKDRKSSFLSRDEGGSVAACVGGDNMRVQPNGQFAPLPVCTLIDRGLMWGTRLELRPADDHLLYAGLDQGYKSGGFGLGGVGGYKPEKIRAYTLGSKSKFFDQRLQLNLEGFFYNYTDMQIALIDGTEIRTENSDTRMWGVELEAVAMPIEGLQLRAVVNRLFTETIDYFSMDPSVVDDPEREYRLVQRDTAEDAGRAFPGNTICQKFTPTRRTQVRCATLGDSNGLDDYSGNRLSRSPEWKYTLSGEYAIPLGRFGTLTPRAQYAWVDDSYQRVFNTAADLQESYHKTDLKLIWNSPEERWSVEAFIDNIENEAVKDYILIGSRVFNAPPLAWYSEPRFYGLQVGFKY